MLGAASGAVAGLVAITPAAGNVGIPGAFVIGIAAGLVCLWGVNGLKRMHRRRRHARRVRRARVGGILGALLTGIFVSPALGGPSVVSDWVTGKTEYPGLPRAAVDPGEGGRHHDRLVGVVAFVVVQDRRHDGRPARAGRRGARRPRHHVARRVGVPDVTAAVATSPQRRIRGADHGAPFRSAQMRLTPCDLRRRYFARLRFARGCAASYTLASAWKSRCVYTCVLAIDAWPSISCTARRSPDDCSTCDANEWRSMCGCTCRDRPWRIAHSREPLLDRARRQPASAAADEHRGLARRRVRRARNASQRVDRVARRGADRHDALLAALAEHAHFAARKIAAGDVELRELGQPQARRIGELEQRAIAQRERIVAVDRHELRRFLGRQRRRQSARRFRRLDARRTDRPRASGRARSGNGRTRATPRACARGCVRTVRARAASRRSASAARRVERRATGVVAGQSRAAARRRAGRRCAYAAAASRDAVRTRRAAPRSRPADSGRSARRRHRHRLRRGQEARDRDARELGEPQQVDGAHAGVEAMRVVAASASMPNVCSVRSGR